MRRSILATFAVSILALAGCGGVPMAQVKGTVKYDGQPLKNGTIRFEAAGVKPATGRIVNGEIVDLHTFKPNDGVPVGSHKVAIWALEDAAADTAKNPGEAKVGANYMSGKSLIPAIYNDPATSGLTAEIKSGGDNTVAFELKKDAK